MKFTVAIDGPAAAGKGTVSKAVAARFGFAHLDTGLLYRAVGRKALDVGSVDDAAQLALELEPEDLTRDDLRTIEVAGMASKVATMPAVRAALVEFQKNFAQREGGAVLDGRDIGTVICPDADVKLFVSASEEVRAKRRFEELCAKGDDVTFEGVLKALQERDVQDATRDAAPMARAFDAVLIDTSDLSIEAAIATAISEVNAKIL